MRDRDAWRAYQRQFASQKRARRLAQARELLGGRCAVCGETELLEFDHVDPATKTFTISRHIGSYPWVRLVGELAKCQLLCVPHHDEKTARERMVHGSKTRYYAGCRCATCVQGHAEHLARRRQHVGTPSS